MRPNNENGRGVTIFCYSCAEDAPITLIDKIGEDPYWTDCRGFRDPHLDKTMINAWHDGRHDDMRMQLVYHPQFGKLLSKIKNFVTSSVAAEEKTITLAFWCKHGRHRSVSGAELFGRVLMRVLNLSNVKIRHLTEEHNTGHWHYCHECNYPELKYVNGVIDLWTNTRRKMPIPAAQTYERGP